MQLTSSEDFRIRALCYRCGPPCELGAEDPDPPLTRGLAIGADAALRAGAPPRGDEEDTRELAGGRRTDDAVGGACMLAPLGELLRSICCETRPRLRTLPRATPRPAEPLRTSAWFVISRTGPAGATRLTAKVRPGVAGGLGTLKVRGAFVMRGTVFHPAQVLPGCQNQP